MHGYAVYYPNEDGDRAIAVANSRGFAYVSPEEIRAKKAQIRRLLASLLPRLGTIADIAGMPEQTEEAAVGRKRRTGGYHGRTEVA